MRLHKDTIGLLHARTVTRQHTGNEQLHTALRSRIIIELAKGLLAARQNITLNHAFDALRRHVRDHRILHSNVARDVIDSDFTPSDPPADLHIRQAPSTRRSRAAAQPCVDEFGRGRAEGAEVS